jgi:RHS repeat-associated protein
MNRCLLDTDVLSWYLREHAQVVQHVVEYLQHYPHLELSVMSYYELRRGLVRIGAWRRIEQLEAFMQRCRVWEVSQEVAQVAAEIAGELAARGERLDDADVLIGATARVLGIGVAMGNVRHFSRIRGIGGRGLVSRGIEAVLMIDHTQGNQVRLDWLLYDGHGNLVRLMAPDYTLSPFQWRGVWGEVQGSLGTGRGYCANLGHPEDETGLVYMRARYYEPATGRFISEDPARDGVNWYLYADGNPVNKVDVEGTTPASVLLAIAQTAGLILGLLVGHLFSSLVLEYLNPGYKSTLRQFYPSAALLIIGGEALKLVAQLKSDPGYSPEDLGTTFKRIRNSLRQTGWVRYGRAVGPTFVVGLAIGVAAGIVEYLTSDYYQNG